MLLGCRVIVSLARFVQTVDSTSCIQVWASVVEGFFRSIEGGSYAFAYLCMVYLVSLYENAGSLYAILCSLWVMLTGIMRS